MLDLKIPVPSCWVLFPQLNLFGACSDQLPPFSLNLCIEGGSHQQHTRRSRGHHILALKGLALIQQLECVVQCFIVEYSRLRCMSGKFEVKKWR
jgi:hypothetical protein